jgi:hypothetical protein
MRAPVAFPLLEATIDAIHQAYKARQLTARQLVQLYLDRIEAYDQTGPAITRSLRAMPPRWQKPTGSMPRWWRQALWARSTAFRWW